MHADKSRKKQIAGAYSSGWQRLKRKDRFAYLRDTEMSVDTKAGVGTHERHSKTCILLLHGIPRRTKAAGVVNRRDSTAPFASRAAIGPLGVKLPPKFWRLCAEPRQTGDHEIVNQRNGQNI